MDQTFERRKKELAILLQVPKDQRKELKAIMDSLEAEGKVHVSKKGKYTKGEAKRIVGTYQAHARGFGFVAVEGEDDDIFISEDEVYQGRIRAVRALERSSHRTQSSCGTYEIWGRQ